jgi:hypothetical protein
MKSAPTIALPAMVKKEAAQSAFRMLDSFKPNTGDMQGHLKIYEDLQGAMDQHALSDKMTIRYNFKAPFEAKIYEREGWNHVPTEQSTLTYYTEGSRKDEMTGRGIYGPSVRYYKALGALTTIFQAKMCARICLYTEGLANMHVCIMSDSQAALRALKLYTFTSKLVAKCFDNLKRLTTKCKLTFM